MRVALVLPALLALAGCAPVYYEEGYYQPRRYAYHHHHRYRERYREASYFHTDQHGVVDEFGQGWSRCRVYGRPAWCRVD